MTQIYVIILTDKTSRKKHYCQQALLCKLRLTNKHQLIAVIIFNFITLFVSGSRLNIIKISYLQQYPGAFGNHSRKRQAGKWHINQRASWKLNSLFWFFHSVLFLLPFRRKYWRWMRFLQNRMRRLFLRQKACGFSKTLTWLFQLIKREIIFIFWNMKAKKNNSATDFINIHY